jgi:hypothetical protein
MMLNKIGEEVSPDTRFLFESVYALVETAHLAFLAWDDESFRFVHENLLFQGAVEEGSLDIDLECFEVSSGNN